MSIARWDESQVFSLLERLCRRALSSDFEKLAYILQLEFNHGWLTSASSSVSVTLELNKSSPPLDFESFCSSSPHTPQHCV